MNSEDLGGPRLVSLRLFHGSLYERSFQGFDVRFQAIFKWDKIGPFLVSVRPRLKLYFILRDDAASPQDERSCDDILKLPNIAGPMMIA